MEGLIMALSEKLLDLWKSSAIIQGTIALVLTVTVCYMYAEQKPVPVELVGILTLIIGYYFGTKTQQYRNKEDMINVTGRKHGIDEGTN